MIHEPSEEMPLPQLNPTKTQAWGRLAQLATEEQAVSLKQIFGKDSQRYEKYSLQCGELLLDYSKNRVSDTVLENLLSLAQELKLKQQIRAMFLAKNINASENRPALHVALRGTTTLGSNAQTLKKTIEEQQNNIQRCCEKVHSGEWRGVTGKSVTDIVNIGIGGSYLGPQMACQALREYALPNVHVHFLSNVDGAEIKHLLSSLNPETTLFLVSSKTFTTQDTLLNTNTAIHWLESSLKIQDAQSTTHFIAITAAPDNAQKFGFNRSRIFTFWDWVGGRFSLWSSVGLSIALSVGYHNYQQLLEGARQMDDHFQTAPLSKNIPVIMALIGIWNINFLGAQTQAVVPYCQRLSFLPDYLQQLEMESNGKSVSKDNTCIDYATAPIIWGQTGTNAQHSFFQLLHQSNHLVPVDFIGFIDDPSSDPSHHRVLVSNMLAQASALMTGTMDQNSPAYKIQAGDKPSNTLIIKSLSPHNLGSLIALYEHKVFAQGILWNINSFDQWGVELGKKITLNLQQKAGDSPVTLDPSTQKLFQLMLS